METGGPPTAPNRRFLPAGGAVERQSQLVVAFAHAGSIALLRLTVG